MPCFGDLQSKVCGGIKSSPKALKQHILPERTCDYLYIQCKCPKLAANRLANYPSFLFQCYSTPPIPTQCDHKEKHVKFPPPKKCPTGVSRGVHEHERASTSPAALILESVRRHKRFGINVIPRNTTNQPASQYFQYFYCPEKSWASCKRSLMRGSSNGSNRISTRAMAQNCAA